MRTLEEMDINKVVRAIEDDAGHILPGLRESLAQAKTGEFSRVHSPEQIVSRRPSPEGSLLGNPEDRNR